MNEPTGTQSNDNYIQVQADVYNNMADVYGRFELAGNLAKQGIDFDMKFVMCALSLEELQRRFDSLKVTV